MVVVGVGTVVVGAAVVGAVVGVADGDRRSVGVGAPDGVLLLGAPDGVQDGARVGALAGVFGCAAAVSGLMAIGLGVAGGAVGNLRFATADEHFLGVLMRTK